MPPSYYKDGARGVKRLKPALDKTPNLVLPSPLLDGVTVHFFLSVCVCVCVKVWFEVDNSLIRAVVHVSYHHLAAIEWSNIYDPLIVHLTSKITNKTNFLSNHKRNKKRNDNDFNCNL